MRSEDRRGAAYYYFTEAMRRVETALHGRLAESLLVPEAWTEIARRRGPPGRVRVTLRVDADAVAFFKSMGAGHLSRMNDVLVAFVQARIAGILPGAEAAGGSVLAAMKAEAEAEAKRTSRGRRMLERSMAEQAEREAAFDALPAEKKRRARLAELKAAAAARQAGKGVRGER